MAITLHHVAHQSPRPEDAVSFYVDDWGLRRSSREDDSGTYLAASLDADDDYSLVIIPSHQKSVDHFCLVSDDRGELQSVRERAQAGGVVFLEDMASSPGVEDAFWIVDLDGRRVQIGYRPSAEEVEHSERDAVPLKAGHIVLNTPDIEVATNWYVENLGFGVRDWRATQMSFLYYNNDHHTVAFNQAKHASLNHVAWELGGINEFFRAVGRTSQSTTGEKLYGPGRHGPGDYVFCYFLDPSGFICEYETDGIKVLDPKDYEFRVWEYSPESADQWLGTLSGGLPQRFRDCALGEPDPNWLSPAQA